ncbi:hypothetical protein FGG78_41105, partial [Thioclava sp. BHET1]
MDGPCDHGVRVRPGPGLCPEKSRPACAWAGVRISGTMKLVWGARAALDWGMTLILHGYPFSVYLRVVRLVLAEKAIAYTFRPLDPFAEPAAPELLRLHPFGRVPVLEDGAF